MTVLGRPAAFFGWCLLCVGLATQFAEAQKSIPNGPEAYTQRKLRADIAKAREHYVRLYRKHTKDPKAVQDEAVEFLRTVYCQWLPVFTRGDWPQVAAIGKEAVGRKVVKDGSHDPLVETCLGWAIMMTAQTANGGNPRAATDEANKLLVSALKNFKEHGYPDSAAFCTVKFLAELAAATRDGAALKRYNKLGMEMAVALVGDKNIPADDQRMVAFDLDSFVASLALPERKSLLDACAKQPGADPWTVDLLTGTYYVDLAWHYRGGGSAATVTREKGKLFEENLQQAVKYLVRAWEARPKFPEAPNRMIVVAMAGASDLSPRDWFDRTVAAQIDYVPAYMSLLTALQPRWGGSHEAIEALARECLATRRFDTVAPLMLFNAFGRIDDELGGKREIWKRPEVYADGRACLEGMLQEPSMADGKEEEEPHSRQMSRYVAIAIHAGQYADARRMLDKVGERLHPDIIGRYKLSVPYDIARLCALTGEAAEIVQNAEQLFTGPNQTRPETSKKALALLETAAKKNADPRASPYFDFHIASLKMQEDFEAGKWVNLTFDKGLTGWRTTGGRWEARGGSEITGHFETHVNTFGLVRKLALPRPFEVEVKLSWDEKTAPQCHVGVCVGTWIQGINTGGNGKLFGFRPANRGYVAYSIYAPTKSARMPDASSPVTLNIKVWDGHFTMYVNGQLKLNAPDARFKSSDEIGFGSDNTLGKTGTVTFSDFRIRKLDEKPDTEHILKLPSLYSGSGGPLRSRADSAADRPDRSRPPSECPQNSVHALLSLLSRPLRVNL